MGRERGKRGVAVERTREGVVVTKIEVLKLCVLSGVQVALGALLVIEVQLLKQLRRDVIENRKIRELAEQLQVDLFVEGERSE